MPGFDRNKLDGVICAALVCGTLCVGLGAGVGVASAQDEEDAKSKRVSDLYVAAVKLYNEGRNRESIAKFDEAIALDPQPVFHCNRAAVLLKVSELDRAIEDLLICRDEYSSTPEERAAIDAQLRAVETIDRAIIPLAREIAGRIANPLERPIEPPPEIEEPKNRPLRKVGYATIGVGSAMVIGAGVLDITSKGLKEDFVRESEGGPGTSEAEYERLRAQMRTRQVAFYALGLGGIGLNTIGISSLVLDGLGVGQSTPEAKLSITPARSGGAVELRVRF